MGSYDAETINAANPLARFAHRNRVKRSIALAVERMGESGKLLDYGCGSGVFVRAMLAMRDGCAVGYEPFMSERTAAGLPIYQSLDEAAAHGPFALITLFETLEHLGDRQIDEFLAACDRLLLPGGSILISAPIEVGPALFMKDMNRSLLKFRRSEHRIVELLKAGFFGVPARRATDLLTSHRGFDFRRAAAYLTQRGWRVQVLRYGPLPIGTWYGNSQVYMSASRSGAARSS